MTNPNIERKAIFLLLLVSIVWGAGFFMTDIALKSFTTFQVLTVRFFIGASVLTFMFRKSIRTISKDDVIAGFLCGFPLAIAFCIQVYGQYFSTPSISAFITVAYVVLIPIFSKIFFKKQISKIIFFSATLILIGIFAITAGTFNENIKALNMPLGITLTVICALAYSIQILTVEYCTNTDKFNLNPTNLTICMLWVAFLVCLLFALFSYFLLGEKIVYSNDTLISFLSIIYLGMFSTAFAFMVQNYSQRYVQASKVAIILSLESVFGALLSAIFLKEQFSNLMIFGFFIVFIAVLITELSPIKNNNNKSTNEN